MFPVLKFEHMGERFDPTRPVPADHPMVALRPDLFTADPPVKPSKRKSAKEATS